MSKVGTKLSINPDRLSKIVETLTNVVEEIINHSTDFIEIHNTYTAYTSLLLLQGTGHRPVIDPFCYRNDFCLSENFVIIEDKVMVEDCRFRFAVFPQLAKDQVNFYISHLKWLISHLSQNNEHLSLCCNIKNNLYPDTPKDKRKLPFLFFLKRKEDNILTYSVSESTLDNILEEIWPFPYNISRHFLSTSTRHKYIEALLSNNPSSVQTIPLIEQNIGHTESIETPFSKSMLFSPSEFINELHKGINFDLFSQGWKVLTPRRHFVDLTLIKHPNTKESIDYPLLGPIERQKERLKNKEKDRSVVRDALQQYKVDEIKRNPALIEHIKSSVLNASIDCPDRTNHRLLLLWKYLLRLKHKNTDLKLPSRLLIIRKDPSPFTESCMDEYRKSIALREGFIKYLENQGKTTDKNNIPKERRIAEIIISASLFDAITNPNIIQSILDTMLTTANEGGYNYLNIIDSNKIKSFGSFRWIMQPLSATLVHSLEQYDSNNINSELITKEVRSILHLIFGTRYKYPIERLCIISQAYWLFHLPPYLREIRNGSTDTSPLKEESLVRTLRSEAIVEDNGKAVNNQKPKTSNDDNLISFGKSSYVHSSCIAFSKDLRVILTEARNHVGKRNKSASRSKKEYLLNSIEDKLSSDKRYPEIGVALLHWGRKLTTSGTDLYGSIKFNTVYQYLSMLSNLLIDEVGSSSFINMTPIYYEELYNLILETSNQKDKSKLRNNLKDFHAFLLKLKLVPKLEWELVKPDNIDTEEYRSNAIIITPDEYTLCLDLLEDLGNTGKMDKTLSGLYSALIILGYRFGLRFGEALYLRYENIQSTDIDPFYIIHTRNTEYRDIKSDIGTRQVPLIGKLSELEINIISAFFIRKTPRKSSDLVFFDKNDSSEVINPIKTSSDLHALLRHVTGDPSIVFHSLRHSFANRIYLLLLEERIGKIGPINKLANINTGSTSQSTVELLTGHASRHHIILDAIAALMGHSSVTTTFTSYIHITDFVTHHYCSDVKHQYFESISSIDHVAAYISLSNYKSIAKRRQRERLSSSDLSSLLELLNKKIINTSNIKTTSEKPDIKHLVFSNNEHTSYNLQTIENLLLHQQLPQFSDIKSLSDLFYLDKSIVKQILTSFEILSNSSGFSIYSNDINSLPYRNNSTFHKETNSLWKILTDYSKILSTINDTDKITILHGVDSWAESYHCTSKYRPLVFDSADKLVNYFDALKILNIPTDLLSVSIPENGCTWVTYKNGKLYVATRDITKRYTVKSIKTNKTDVPMQEKYARSPKSRLGISLEKTSNHVIHFQKRLDRLLFLIGIYLRSTETKS